MIYGNEELVEGENIVTIEVRAEDGTSKVYTIYVTKTDDIEITNANLKSITIKGFSIYPAFKSNIYNYNLLINENITKLQITAEAEFEGATVEIIGNENLKEGDNLIKIKVTAQNGLTVREYKINTFISSEVVEGKQINKNQGIVVCSVLGALVLIAAGFTFKKK